MTGLKTSLFRIGMDVLHATRLYRALAGVASGRGIIFTAHHIRPPEKHEENRDLHPNRILEITPEFLANVINIVRAHGFDILSFHDALDRMQTPDTRPFAVFTLDDGYQDNIDYGLPVFDRHNCPFTVFITPKIIEGVCELWWLALERLVLAHDEITYMSGRETTVLKCATTSEKISAYQSLYWIVRAMEQKPQRMFIRELCHRYGLDLDGLCAAQAMNWDQVRILNAHPLATIGAHSVNHYALKALSEAEVMSELVESRAWIGEETGTEPDLFCYPYGDKGSAAAREFTLTERAGFRAAVTTRKGLLFNGHKDHLTALPRVSLNGDYQDSKYIELYLSGVPFALWNGFRRLNVA